MNRYYGYPQSFYHNIQVYGNCIDPDNPTYYLYRSDFVATSDRWYHMAKNAADTTNNKSTEYVNDLMLDVGDRINMHYSGTGSGAWPSTYGFSFFDLACSQRTVFSTNTVRSNINNSRPVILVAYGYDNLGEMSGHTWLADGLARKTTQYTHCFHLEYSDQWIHADRYFDSEEQMLRQFPNGYDGYSLEQVVENSVDYFLMKS